MNSRTLSLLIFIAVTAVYSSTPDYITVQHAGHRGFISIGAGYTYLNTMLSTSFLYGYTPSQLSGTSVHSLTLDQRIHPINFNITSSIGLAPELGISIIASPQYAIVVNDRFRSYYWPDGLRIGYYAGFKISHTTGSNTIKSISLSVLAGTLNSYILYAVNNTSVSAFDITTLTMSAHFYI